MNVGPPEIEVLLIDGQPIVREGVKAVLAAEEDMAVVGEAENAEEAFNLIRNNVKEIPYIVILDIELEGEEDGLDLCRKIKSLADPPSVVVYTVRNCPEEVFGSKISGADSFVYKGEEPDKLLEALRETRLGKKVWFMGQGEGRPKRRHYSSARGSSVDGFSLTPREKEVFALIVRRYTNPEIANELSISPQTAKNHVSSVLKKFGACSRVDLIQGS